MADHLRKYEALYVCHARPFIQESDLQRGFRFNLTPQRMRMIVEAFKDSLELGLSKHGQIVVSTSLVSFSTTIDVLWANGR